MVMVMVMADVALLVMSIGPVFVVVVELVVFVLAWFELVSTTALDLGPESGFAAVPLPGQTFVSFLRS